MHMMHTQFPASRLLGVLAALLLAACASGPPVAQDGVGTASAPASLGERISASALAQLGRPYRYGGNGPEFFDCSGLVRFAHAAQGIGVPRTTEDQLRAARPIAEHEILAGDVLFFRFEGDKVSHVAIYTGDGQFVHAPQSGRAVETRPLADSWYRRRLVGVGRLH
jgi:cell wall-associated NlpC family hydrolase